MSVELPSFKTVCATVQREEVRIRVMNVEPNLKLSEAQGYVANHRNHDAKMYRGKTPHLKCKYCNAYGHTEERCWELHPELKPKFKDNRMMVPRSSSVAPLKA